MATVAARLLASPILQEYDISTVVELAVNPANQFENLTAGHSEKLADRPYLWIDSVPLAGFNRVFRSIILHLPYQNCKVAKVPRVLRNRPFQEKKTQ